MNHHYDFAPAIQVVLKGGIIAYPTEAVFGLGCDPRNESAIQTLLDLKQRDPAKGLILIAANWQQLDSYIKPLSDGIYQRVMSTWPGPVTWLLPARSDVSTLIRGSHDKIAIRISAHPACQALCQGLQHPLISTSANIASQPPERTAQGVARQFAEKVNFIVDQPLGTLEKPTEIRDAVLNTCIRAG